MGRKAYLIAGIFGVCQLTWTAAARAQQPRMLLPDTTAIKDLFFAGLREKLNEDYPRAAERFEKVIAMDPNHAAAYYELAVLNFRQNRLPEAELAIRRATSVERNNVWYWKLLAELYKRKGDMLSLIDVFNELIRLSPNDDSFYFDRANALLLSGNTKAAMDGYDELEKKFGSSEALTKARARVSAKDMHPDIAHPQLPKNTVAPDMAAGEQLYKQGDLAAALVQFNAILAAGKGQFKVWERKLQSEIGLGLYSQAIKSSEDALSLYPNQAVLYYYAALALFREGDLKPALDRIKSALQFDSENKVYLDLEKKINEKKSIK
ncbi:tetratricopeptide repeat protein [Pedobacter faecalis]|uniref:tetratricopeptide repeat protein n=1 Tax=Pedobacter faecalis TaxID=3041495 RepID=UPI00254D2CC1|nr:tetratricopeptide repeat protein [Pedobacter sp. ELA7]